MTKYVFTAIFIACFTFSIAQILPDGVSLTVGNEFSTSGNEEIKRIVTQNNGNVIAYTRVGSKLELLLFDENLNLIRSNKVNLTSGDKKLNFVRIEETEKGVFAFSTFKDVRFNREALYYQKIDQTNLTLSAATILHTKAYNKFGGAINFFVSTSPNKELIMVDVTSKVSNESKDYGHETFDIVVYDSDFERVWRDDEIELREDDDRLYRSDRKVTDEGKVVMMVLSFNGGFDELESADEVLNMFKYYVTVISKEDYVMFELKLEAGYFADLSYEIGQDGKLCVVAVSFDKEEDERSWYFTVIDTDSNSFIVENKIELEESNGLLFYTEDTEDEVVKLVRSSEFVSETSNLSSNILIDNMFIDSEGVTVTFESSVTSAEYNTKTKNLIGVGASRFSFSGEQQWIQSFQKVQFSSSKIEHKRYISCGVLFSEGKVSFVFNFKAIQETNGDLNRHNWSPENPSDLYVATIDKTGDLSINALLNGSKKPFWIPALNFTTKKDELVFMGFSGKVSKLAKLSIK